MLAGVLSVYLRSVSRLWSLSTVTWWLCACVGVSGPAGPEGPAGPVGPPGQDYTPDLLVADAAYVDLATGEADLQPFTCAPGALVPEGPDNWICSHSGHDAVRELDSPIIASRLKLVTGNGNTLRIDDLGPTFLTYSPSEVGASTWAAHVLGFPNNGSTRLNQVFRWGWNLAAGGGLIVPGEAAIGDEWESYYVAGSQYVERHIAYVNPAGHVYRPLSWRIDRQTDEIVQLVTGSSVKWMDRSGVQLFSLELSGPVTGTLALGTQQPLLHSLNDVPLIAQRNAAGTANVEVARVDSSDAVVLANNGNPTVVGGTFSVRGETVSPKGIRLGDSVANQPACTAATRGRMWISQGGPGVADELSVCMKSAADVYAWRTVM